MFLLIPCLSLMTSEISHGSLLTARFRTRFILTYISFFLLRRCHPLPSKDVLEIFIRSSALQAGMKPNSPWVVHEDLVKKYLLSSKLIPSLLSPTRVSTVHTIYFAYRYCHDFGLGRGNRDGLISRFCDVFITIDSHILKWKCL